MNLVALEEGGCQTIITRTTASASIHELTTSFQLTFIFIPLRFHLICRVVNPRRLRRSMHCEIAIFRNYFHPDLL